MPTADQTALSSWDSVDGQLIQSSAQISALLDRLVASTAPGQLHLADEAQILPTTVRSRPSDSVLRLDMPASLDSGRVMTDAEAWLQVKDELGVPIRFPTRIYGGDSRALLVDVPDKVLRIQRRESHRVAVARSGVSILTDNLALRAARLVDISLGGVGFVVAPSDAALLPKVGDRVPAQLRIVIPGSDALNVPVTLEIRNQFAHGGLNAFRVGVAFHGLTPTQEQKLHRICMNLSRSVLRPRAT